MLWVSLKCTLALVRICVCVCALFSGGFLRPYFFSLFLSLSGAFCIAKWLVTIAVRTRAYQQATGIDSLTSIHKLTHPTFFSKHWFAQCVVATSEFFSARGTFFSEYFGVCESSRAIDHGFLLSFFTVLFCTWSKNGYVYTFYLSAIHFLNIHNKSTLIRGLHSIVSQVRPRFRISLIELSQFKFKSNNLQLKTVSSQKWDMIKGFWFVI